MSNTRKRALSRMFASFLCLMALLSLVSLPRASAAPPAAGVQVISDAIARVDFSEDWKFYLATRDPAIEGGGTSAANFAANGIADAGDYTTAQAISPALDDSAWRTIKVPHDFSIEGNRVPASATTNISTTNNTQGWLQGGLGWYRKSFVLPASMEDGKRVQIEFGGVYQNSNVYVNGQFVGNYPSGYTGFTYDITDYLTYGEDAPNVVVVKVQNMSPSGRWYTGSGITGPVSLVVTGQTRFLRNGLVILSPDLETSYKADGSVEVKLTAKAYSQDSNGTLRLRTQVYNPDGTLKAEHLADLIPSSPNTLHEVSDEFVIPGITLWSIENPYRYTFVTDLIYEQSGGTGAVVTDSVTQKIGFRWFKVDNDKGAFLNDEYLKIQGVNLHHDEGALGAAGTYDAYKRKMLILQDMGINALRTAHNPPSKAMIDVCSELGIIVVEEAYDGWGATKSTYDFGAFFLREVPTDWAGTLENLPAHTLWSDWVIKEMVARDINEPSVVMWSIGNEVRGVGTRPSWYNWNDYAGETDPKPASYTATTFNEYTEALRLRNDVRAVDTSRYIVMGGDQERTPPGLTATWGMVNQALDGYGLNYNSAASKDKLYADYAATTFFFESESSCHTALRGVYFTPSLTNTPPNQTPGNRGLSVYDNNFSSWAIPNEYAIKDDRDREFFTGQFIWAGVDYLGEPTPFNDTYPFGVSLKGRLDTAGFKKDTYYVYRAQWAKDNTTHIVPMNWNDWYPGEEVEVWVYTNAIKAELFLNGVSLGVRSFDQKTTTFGAPYLETTEPTKDSGGTGYGVNNTTGINTGGYVSPNGSYGKLHLTWIVPFAPGELKAVSYDAAGEIVGQDVIKTAGTAYTVRMQPDRTVVKSDGNSLVYFEVDVVDKDGNPLPSANNLIKFDVTGGKIVGVDNGKPDSTEFYKWESLDRNVHSEREAFNGKVLCIVEADKAPGEIVLTASSENMVSATVKVLKTADGSGSYDAVSVPASLGEPVSAVVANGAVTVATGKAPILPATAEVTYESGAKLLEKITWGAVSQADFARAGTVAVTGTAAGLPVTADITVSAAVVRSNIALNTGAAAQDFRLTETSGPLATASFTTGTNYPNNILNGNTTNSWSNRSTSIAATIVLAAVPNNTRPYDWVSVYWMGNQEVSEADIYFTIGGSGPSNTLPSAVKVQYWDGLAWVDAANQETVFATTSNEQTKITFDPVVTTKIRVCMWNATPFTTAGAMTVTKLEIYNKESSAEEEVFHTVTFDAQGGSTVEAATVAEGQTVARPEDPARAGYTFDGWYTEAACENAWDFGTAVTADLVLYAKWIANTYTVTFDYNGGVGEVPSKEIVFGEPYGALPLPARVGFAFIGWYLGTTAEPGSLVTADTVVTTPDDHTLTALWEAAQRIATADIRTEATSDVQQPLVYILSLEGMKGVMNVRITFEVDGDMLASAGMEVLSSAFTALNAKGGTIRWTEKEDNIWQGELLLMFLGGEAGFTSEESVDVVKLFFHAKQLGSATVKLTGLLVTGLDETFSGITLESEIRTDEATTNVVRVYSKYDLNQDGVVDERDLAMAQRFYQAKIGDANWNEAKACDFNNDDTVDMLDLVDLFLHFGTQ